MDDHGAHHYQSPDSDDEDATTLADTDEKSEGEEADEVRDGIPDEQDLEARPSRIQRVKSTRSIKDPNLVSVPQMVLMICVDV